MQTDLLKKIELNLRAGNQLTYDLLNDISELSDWDIQIVNNFILRVKRSIELGRVEFIYKYFDAFDSAPQNYFKTNNKLDLLVCQLRRNESDYYLTDAKNRLVIPDELSKHDFFEIWGYDVTTARNICINHALQHNFKYVLFIDDDILAPNNALLRLYNTHKSKNSLVTAAQYFKKINPLISAHANIPSDSNDVLETDLVAMGFTLIDLEEILKSVPLPLFWNFIDKNGIWSMGEDAFFTKNIISYTNKKPIIDTSIKCLHFDKAYKTMYGVREKDTQYASHIWDIDRNVFFKNRTPVKFPPLQLSLPRRSHTSPIAFNPTKLLTYRTYYMYLEQVVNQPVDVARNMLVEIALQRDAEFVLFLDDDIIPPHDILPKLIDSFYDIKYNIDDSICCIAGNYYLKDNTLLLSAHLNTDTESGKVMEINKLPPSQKNQKYIKSNWLVALGCSLIHTDVFKQMRKPYFVCYDITNENRLVNEDAHFTELVLRSGYNLYIDPSIECLHYDFIKNTYVGVYDPKVKYATDINLI